MQGEEPSRSEIEAALAKLAEWEPFARSPQLVDFLRYVVEAKLQGDEQHIKAYAIAVDVFGRKQDFDPQKDSIVRVQAGRLRSLLKEYYAGPGAAEPVKFKLPVGRYVPQFVVAKTEETKRSELPAAWNRSPTLRYFAIGALILAVLVGVFGGYLIAGHQIGHRSSQVRQASAVEPVIAPDRPIVVVGRFNNQTGDDAFLDSVVTFSSLVAGDIAKFGTVDLRMDLSGSFSSLEHLVTPSERVFVTTGTFKWADDKLELHLLVTDAADGDVIFAQTLKVQHTGQPLPEDLEELSQKLAARVGSLSGPLHSEIAVKLPALAASLDEPTLYSCKVYLQQGLAPNARHARDQARVCFTRYIANSDAVSSTEAKAALSLLNLNGEDERPIAPNFMPERVPELLASVRLARAELPDNAFVAFQLARVYERSHFYPEARDSYEKALENNPSDPVIRAAYGNLLALRLDAWEDGMRQIALAKGLMGSGPPWFELVPALDSLVHGDFDDALSSAQILYQDDPALSSVISLVAVWASNKTLLYDRYYPLVVSTPVFHQVGIGPFLERRISNQGIVTFLKNSLINAGVQATYINAPVPQSSSSRNSEETK